MSELAELRDHFIDEPAERGEVVEIDAEFPDAQLDETREFRSCRRGSGSEGADHEIEIAAPLGLGEVCVIGRKVRIELGDELDLRQRSAGLPTTVHQSLVRR